MSDMTMVMLVMAGVALVIAVSWQLAGRQPFDAIQFAARLAASFCAAAAMAAVLYGLLFVIGIAGGSGSDMDRILQAAFWFSIAIAFVLAISPGESRKLPLLRFIARWIVAWVCVVGAGILLLLGVCAVMISV